MEVSKIKVAAVRDFENNIAKNEADVAGCQCYSDIWNFNLKCSTVFNIFVNLVRNLKITSYIYSTLDTHYEVGYLSTSYS